MTIAAYEMNSAGMTVIKRGFATWTAAGDWVRATYNIGTFVSLSDSQIFITKSGIEIHISKAS